MRSAELEPVIKKLYDRLGWRPSDAGLAREAIEVALEEAFGLGPRKAREVAQPFAEPPRVAIERDAAVNIIKAIVAECVAEEFGEGVG